MAKRPDPDAGTTEHLSTSSKEVIGDLVQKPVSAAEAEAKVLRAEVVAAEDTLRTGGQRRINFIWEITQASVALMVTATGMFTAANLALSGEKNDSAFLLLGNTLFLVIGAYFSRTNHQKMGGVGEKLPNETR